MIQPSIKPSLKIDTWELEGLDYLFQDPKVGKDWLCVRCNWEDALGIVRFAQHPLESGCALDHFNKKGLKCHDSSRSYTWDDILREFTFRGMHMIYLVVFACFANLFSKLTKQTSTRIGSRRTTFRLKRRLQPRHPRGRGRARPSSQSSRQQTEKRWIHHMSQRQT